MNFSTIKNLLNSRRAWGHGIPNKEQELLSCRYYSNEQEDTEI